MVKTYSHIIIWYFLCFGSRINALLWSTFFFLYVDIWPWFWRGWKDVDDDDDGFSCSFESLSVAICLSSSLVTFFEVNYSLPYSLWSLKSVFHWHKSCTWLILLMASARFQSIKSPYVTINHERESKLDNKIPLQMERRILRGMKLANILSYQMFSSNDSILSMLCHYLGQFQEILDIVLYPLLGWQIVVI